VLDKKFPRKLQKNVLDIKVEIMTGIALQRKQQPMHVLGLTNRIIKFQKILMAQQCSGFRTKVTEKSFFPS
jgi:hypothetical protein